MSPTVREARRFCKIVRLKIEKEVGGQNGKMMWEIKKGKTRWEVKMGKRGGRSKKGKHNSLEYRGTETVAT